MAPLEELKKEAGYKAVDEYVASGMVVGLGTGSTAKYAIERIGQLLQDGKLENIVGLWTSRHTAELAKKAGIPLGSIDEIGEVDVTIDGADEVAPNLDIEKGRMGGILRKKMIGMASKQYICIADETKLVDGIGGSKGALPIEVTQYGYKHVERCVQKLPQLNISRTEFKTMPEGELFVSDHGNYILNVFLESTISDPKAASAAILDIVGVLDHGLFLDLVDVAIVATGDGLKIMKRELALVA
mmetsp:Transcript_33027/g.93488  ORF Transcript_33027/g.93488 Transcript_33027/m.93488 type:complete len:243 (-) Transcript_33027:110-838(-)